MRTELPGRLLLVSKYPVHLAQQRQMWAMQENEDAHMTVSGGMPTSEWNPETNWTKI